MFGGGVVAQRLVAEMYVHRDDIGEGAQEVMPDSQAAGKAVSRKVSKANKAVKHAVSLLKAGTKRSSGADKGKLPKGYWKIATRAAGLANPKTTSVIGKGKSITKALARKIRKWW